MSTMLLAMDVSYNANFATAAGVLFRYWTADSAVRELACSVEGVAPYESGRFFRRELPCLVQLLDQLPIRPELMIIDGYVWLDTKGRAGLGAHLYEYLGRQIPVVGVAKTAFNGALHAISVFRGRSRRPLFITAAGMDDRDAATKVCEMHGCNRIPDMLKRADELCRF
jgi:deoxyribonuclease V